MYTDFDRVWALRSTDEWIRDCLPHPPNPLVKVSGFSVEMMILVSHFLDGSIIFQYFSQVGISSQNVI